jgi:hypothetical protein
MAIILYFLILTLTTTIQFTSKRKNQSFLMFQTCKVVLIFFHLHSAIKNQNLAH